MDNPNPRPRFDTHNPRSRAGQIYLNTVRPIYHAFGFQKGYNFPLYLITVGPLLGFACARFMYLDINGIYFKEGIPGEQFWYRAGHRRIGFYFHIIGVCFGSIFATLQFTPVIRHKFLWFHRISGYLAIILMTLGCVGAFMFVDTAMGGAPYLVIYFGSFGAYVVLALFLAYINIKRLQIDQHRAWMIRAWGTAGSIITLRLILLAAQSVVTNFGYVFWTPVACREIFYMYHLIAQIPDSHNPTSKLYPQCGVDPATSTFEIAIPSSSSRPGPENSTALFRPLFGMSGILATTIHIILIELYLWSTPAESYRLRVFSYEKQVAKGLRKKGAFMEAGLGPTRFGDAPEWWSISEEDYLLAKKLEQNQMKNGVGENGNGDLEAMSKAKRSTSPSR